MPTTKVKTCFTNKEIAEYIERCAINFSFKSPQAVLKWMSLSIDDLDERVLARAAFLTVMRTFKNGKEQCMFYEANVFTQAMYLLLIAETIKEGG